MKNLDNDVTKLVPPTIPIWRDKNLLSCSNNNEQPAVLQRPIKYTCVTIPNLVASETMKVLDKGVTKLVPSYTVFKFDVKNVIIVLDHTGWMKAFKVSHPLVDSSNGLCWSRSMCCFSVAPVFVLVATVWVGSTVAVAPCRPYLIKKLSQHSDPNTECYPNGEVPSQKVRLLVLCLTSSYLELGVCSVKF